MEISVYSEFPDARAIEHAIEKYSGIKISIAFPCNKKFDEKIIQVIKQNPKNFDLWPVFPGKNSSAPGFLLHALQGNYWVNELNFTLLSNATESAAKFGIEKIVLDIEYLPFCNRHGLYFRDKISGIIDEMHSQGLKTKVTTTIQTPFYLLPENADTIAIQAYSNPGYWLNNIEKNKHYISSCAWLVKRFFKKSKTGIDLGNLSFPGLTKRKIMGSYFQKANKRLPEEIAFAKSAGIKEIGIYDLSGITDAAIESIAHQAH